MAKQLKNVFPPPGELLKMEPEEIAPFLLGYLNLKEERGEKGQLNRYNFTLETNSELCEYAGELLSSVTKVLMEAWMWLEREGFIAPRPGEQGEWVFITRKGKKLKDLTDFQSYLFGSLLPMKNLDPVLAQKVRPLFIRGDYDTAVFQAYKEVEVRIRKIGGFSDELMGVKLARRAFGPQSGTLTVGDAVEAEKEAVSHLFAGVLGAFKNPSSHRDIDFNNPSEVAEIILFANYLLRVVDSRKKT